MCASLARLSVAQTYSIWNTSIPDNQNQAFDFCAICNSQLALEESAGGEDAVKYFATTISGSYLSIHPEKIIVPENAKKKLPKFSTGETSMKKAIVKKGIENLPGEHLPQRRTWSDDKTLNQGPCKEPKEEAEKS